MSIRFGRLALVALILAAIGAMTVATSTAQELTGPEVAPALPGLPAPPGLPALPTDIPVRLKATAKPAAARRNGAVGRGSIMLLFTKANPMVFLLGVCSVVTLGFTLERMVALRRNRVIPKDFVNRFLERLSSGKLDRDRALELCRANESPVSRVFARIVSHWGQPAATIRQAIGYDAAGEVADLKRNVRALNGTATLAPLLGLLGTVIGMIQSFDALGGRVGPAKGEALAQGISLALVTTALGLGIAIVSVTVYYYLLSKVDVLVRARRPRRQVIDLISGEAIRPATDRRPTQRRARSRGTSRY
ncbi:MAG: MotA/TolQ/ExbB proton channel family protein [Singulisphaera sp.]